MTRVKSGLYPGEPVTEQDLVSGHQVGWTYWSSYWGESYRVLKREGSWVTVIWTSDEHTTRHCTRLEARDRVIERVIS